MEELFALIAEADLKLQQVPADSLPEQAIQAVKQGYRDNLSRSTSLTRVSTDSKSQRTIWRDHYERRDAEYDVRGEENASGRTRCLDHRSPL